MSKPGLLRRLWRATRDVAYVNLGFAAQDAMRTKITEAIRHAEEMERRARGRAQNFEAHNVVELAQQDLVLLAQDALHARIAVDRLEAMLVSLRHAFAADRTNRSTIAKVRIASHLDTIESLIDSIRGEL